MVLGPMAVVMKRDDAKIRKNATDRGRAQRWGPGILEEEEEEPEITIRGAFESLSEWVMGTPNLHGSHP